MRNRILRVGAAVLAVLSSVACGAGSASMTSPTSTVRALAISIQTLVVGLGTAGPYGEGVRLEVWAGAPVTASARIEVNFADGSAGINIPFDPATIRLNANARGSFAASIPDASDPRLEGRKASSFRAAVTLRDDEAREQTVFVALTVTPRS